MNSDLNAIDSAFNFKPGDNQQPGDCNFAHSHSGELISSDPESAVDLNTKG
jgi:hypothetical protein